MFYISNCFSRVEFTYVSFREYKLIHKIIHSFTYLDQVIIESSTLTCPVNSSSINLEITYSNHSGWAPAQNCSLVACTWISLSMSSNCSAPTITCFQYQTANNTIYCAPAALCSLMEPCDVNGQCSLLTSVCVINTCCNASSVCLPLEWTNLCQSTVPPTSE